jgi:hypothetical protein
MRLLISIMGLLAFMGAFYGCGDDNCGSPTPPPPTGSIVWEKTIGGPGDEVPHSIQAAADGGYIVAGSTTPVGDEVSYLYLVKLDAGGDVVWERTFGKPSAAGYYVTQTDDGGYIVTGMTGMVVEVGVGTFSSLFLVKTDAEGSPMWERAYEFYTRNSGRYVFQRSDGGYTVAGQTSGGESSNFGELYVLTLDREGALLSEYVSETPLAGESVVSGHYFPDGAYDLAVFNNDIIKFYWSTMGIARFDPQGNRLDGISLAGYSTGAKSVIWLVEGGYASIGGLPPLSTPPSRMVLLTFDESGNQVVESQFAGSGGADGASLNRAADDGYMLAGSTQTDETQPHDVYLVRTDSAGDSVWEIIHGGDGDDMGGPMARSSDGGWVIAGSTTSFGAGGEDLYVLKVEETQPE